MLVVMKISRALVTGQNRLCFPAMSIDGRENVIDYEMLATKYRPCTTCFVHEVATEHQQRENRVREQVHSGASQSLLTVQEVPTSRFEILVIIRNTDQAQPVLTAFSALKTDQPACLSSE